MLGKTHYKVGVIYFLILFPAIASICTISGYIELAACLLVSAVAALIPDVDCTDSTVNRKNPLTGIPIKTSEIILSLFLYLIRFCIIGLLAILAWEVGKRLKGIETPLLVLLILLTYIALFANRVVTIIPGIGYLYTMIEKKLLSLLCHVKKVIVILAYSAVGVALVIQNFREWQDPVVYVLAAILMAVGFFQHRTFMHAPEGFILMGSVALYLFAKLNLVYLGFAFTLGYFSHILTDALTMTGIPVSFIPTILKILKIHERLQNKPVYKKIMSLLDKRIALRLFRTGSSWEGFVVVALIIICVVEYIIFKPYTSF